MIVIGCCCGCCGIRSALAAAMGLACYFVSDECGGVSGVEADSDEDVVTDYHVGQWQHQHLTYVNNATTNAMRSAGAATVPPPGGQAGAAGYGHTHHGPLPTISVTPHSPANKTSYPVLEDSLRQVRELSETVQKMMQQTTPNAQGSSHVSVGSKKEIPASALNPFFAQMARLSASCPALNEVMTELETLGGSLGSSPMHGPPTRKNSGAQDWLCQPESNRQRRRSWTALEDLREGDDKMKQRRQRSISLSSMESEADESLWDNIDGSRMRLLGPEKSTVAPTVRVRVNRTTSGGASTHSLNEADLQTDFNIVKAKRETIEQLKLLPQRLPLQKSISTPSIIAVGDGELAVVADHEPVLMSGTQPTLATDRHVEKRRKRGSLFFRKKKDKSKKLHQWVSSCYGSSQVCDSCNKPLSNKPALYCECCGTTVHQNGCKDNIVECSKPKGVKSSGKLAGFSVPLTNSKNSTGKRGSGSLSGSIYNSHSSSSQILMGDDKENDHHGHHDSTNFPDDVPLVPLEFLSDSPITAAELCNDYSLGLNDIESESWSPNVGKEVTKKLKEKEIKRQEHIYEFILTEKHHCMTLLVMQKIFVDGLQRHFHMGPDLERMFPRLNDLIEIHLGFLSRLRKRQKEGPVIGSIVDILLDMFSNIQAAKLKSAYGEFCSRHRHAVEMYKYYLQNDSRFAHFVRHCQQNPLLKKKGIPECILFVTQRLTKYPLLIEPLIKTSKENKREQDDLQRALSLVKEILIEVDARVAEKEKEERKLEIYNRVDAKSYTIHRNRKFKKSDILQGNRSLRFEGVAMLMQGRGKMQLVMVIVLSDVLFFLQENSHKYSFFTPDNKAGVVSLQKLLVREKAGQDSRGIYLISSNPSDPEMFELKIHKPKDKQVWIQAIRKAVQTCPEDEEDEQPLSSDEKIMLIHKQNQIKHIIGLLRQKDVEQALLLEEKMALQLRLMEISGLEPPSPPSYRHLVSENVNTEKMWKEVLMAVKEVTRLAGSLYATGTNLSRSVSSVGERQSDTYVSPPQLPKRAETFGGFDSSAALQQQQLLMNAASCQQNKRSPPTILDDDLDTIRPNDSRLFESLPFRNCSITSLAQHHHTLTNGGNADVSSPTTGAVAPSTAHEPNNLLLLSTVGRDQQIAAVQLSHHVYTLLCVISQLMTTNESLQASMGVSGGGVISGGANQSSQNYHHQQQQHHQHNYHDKYGHNKRLEELRNLQDKLSSEKAEWTAKREAEEREMEEKRRDLQRLQEQIRTEENDVRQQREQLYRKMELLTSQGLLISPNIALPMVVGGVSATTMMGGTDGVTENISSCSSSKESSEENSPQSENSSTSNNSNSFSSSHLGAVQSTTIDRRRESHKWNKGVQSQPSKSSQHLPINLISTTNQYKVASSQNSGGAGGVGNAVVKQQLPLKLASRLSTAGAGGGGGLGGMASGGPAHSGVQQVLPLRLSQQQQHHHHHHHEGGGEKERRTSASGYHRLGSDSFSPTSGETTPTLPHAHHHSRTGSSPALMGGGSGALSSGHSSPQSPPGPGARATPSAATRTNTYPKFPDKFRVKNILTNNNNQQQQQQQNNQKTTPEEEIIYF